MSQENVEILRLAYEADLGSQDVLQYLDPNVELYPGIEIDRELPTIFTFRNGLIVRIDGFTDKAEALEAAGLSE